MILRPFRLELQQLQQPLEAIDRRLVELELAAFERHEAVEIETPLHVFHLAFELAVVDRDRRNRRGPFLGEVVGLRALLLVTTQRIRGPRFAAERDFEPLIQRECVAAATLIEIALERDARGEHRRERDDEHCHDERDAALPMTVHPATSTSRTSLPQSSRSSVISTAIGRSREASGPE